MSSRKLSASTTLTTRVLIAVAIATALLVGVMGLGRIGSADAAVETGMMAATCTTPPPLPPQEVDIPFTATNTPDQAEPGDEVSLTVGTSFPTIVASTTKYVDDVETTWPLPAQATAATVTFDTPVEGWTTPLPGDITISIDPTGANSFVKYKLIGGPGTSTNPALPGNVRTPPPVTITITLDETETDYYVEWRGVSKQLTHANTVIGNITSECTPDDPAQVLNSKTAVGDPNPTTTTTSTTTTSTTSTTIPSTTTTTKAPPTPPKITG